MSIKQARSARGIFDEVRLAQIRQRMLDWPPPDGLRHAHTYYCTQAPWCDPATEAMWPRRGS